MCYDDDITYEDEACPRCGRHEVRSRYCDAISCDDGWCDEHDDDPINFGPGEEYSICRECWGTGKLRWCSECGLDITYAEYKRSKETPDVR